MTKKLIQARFRALWRPSECLRPGGMVFMHRDGFADHNKAEGAAPIGLLSEPPDPHGFVTVNYRGWAEIHDVLGTTALMNPLPTISDELQRRYPRVPRWKVARARLRHFIVHHWGDLVGLLMLFAAAAYVWWCTMEPEAMR